MEKSIFRNLSSRRRLLRKVSKKVLPYRQLVHIFSRFALDLATAVLMVSPRWVVA